MSDRISAEIWIGGQVSRTEICHEGEMDDPDGNAVLAQLMAEIERSGVSWEWGSRGIEMDTEEHLLECLENGHLHFMDDEARNGEFEDLENFCVQNGIPFNRRSATDGTYDPELVWFRADMNEPDCVGIDSDGNPVVKRLDVVGARNMLANMLDGVPKPTSDYFNSAGMVYPPLDDNRRAMLDRVLEMLNKACVTAPPLPRFEIVA